MLPGLLMAVSSTTPASPAASAPSTLRTPTTTTCRTRSECLFPLVPTCGYFYELFHHPSYSICVRQEDGFCCVQYTPCTDANSFSIDTLGMMTMAAAADTACSLDYVGIDGTFLNYLYIFFTPQSKSKSSAMVLKDESTF